MSKSSLLLFLFLALILIPIILGTLPRHTSPSKQIIKEEPSISVSPVVSIIETDQNKKLLNKINTRETLAKSDQQVKEQIIATLSQDPSATTLYQSTSVRIDYTAGSNLFQAEILNLDTDSAKKEAVMWFLSKGMSHEGICNLPLDFYLNWDVKQEYNKTHNSFNPLPDGC